MRSPRAQPAVSKCVSKSVSEYIGALVMPLNDHHNKYTSVSTTKYVSKRVSWRLGDESERDSEHADDDEPHIATDALRGAQVGHAVEVDAEEGHDEKEWRGDGRHAPKSLGHLTRGEEEVTRGKVEEDVRLAYDLVAISARPRRDLVAISARSRRFITTAPTMGPIDETVATTDCVVHTTRWMKYMPWKWTVMYRS